MTTAGPPRPAQGDACGLGLKRANGLALHKQRVIRGTRGKGEFANGDTASRAQVDRVLCLDGPAGCREHRVDRFPRALFWSQVRHAKMPWQPPAARIRFRRRRRRSVYRSV